MKTFNDWVPFILLVAQALQVLVLYAFKASIRIAILEQGKEFSKEYASKDDVKKVEAQVDLAGRVDRGFSHTFEMLNEGRRPS
jgi:hypothetical protein